MAEWRDVANRPKGMSDFARWYRPKGIDTKKMPSDGDGILHSKDGNRFILLEFKPKDGYLTIGQRILVAGFSKLPGCMSMVIYDPYSQDRSGEKYPDDEVLHISVFLDGFEQDLYITTVENLNKFIAWWFNNPVPA